MKFWNLLAALVLVSGTAHAQLNDGSALPPASSAGGGGVGIGGAGVFVDNSIIRADGTGDVQGSPCSIFDTGYIYCEGTSPDLYLATTGGWYVDLWSTTTGAFADLHGDDGRLRFDGDASGALLRMNSTTRMAFQANNVDAITFDASTAIPNFPLGFMVDGDPDNPGHYIEATPTYFYMTGPDADAFYVEGDDVDIGGASPTLTVRNGLGAGWRFQLETTPTDFEIGNQDTPFLSFEAHFGEATFFNDVTISNASGYGFLQLGDGTAYADIYSTAGSSWMDLYSDNGVAIMQALTGGSTAEGGFRGGTYSGPWIELLGTNAGAGSTFLGTALASTSRLKVTGGPLLIGTTGVQPVKIGANNIAGLAFDATTAVPTFPLGLVSSTGIVSGSTASNVWTSNVIGTGSVDKSWVLNNALVGAGDLILDLQTGGVSRFSVSQVGGVAMSSGLYAAGITTTSSFEQQSGYHVVVSNSTAAGQNDRLSNSVNAAGEIGWAIGTNAVLSGASLGTTLAAFGHSLSLGGSSVYTMTIKGDGSTAQTGSAEVAVAGVYTTSSDIASITTSTGAITVGSTASWPAGGYAAIITADGNGPILEFVAFTTTDATHLNITGRGKFGTTAATRTNGAQVAFVRTWSGKNDTTIPDFVSVASTFGHIVGIPSGNWNYPALSVSGDMDTGIGSAGGANTLALKAGGVEVLTASSTGVSAGNSFIAQTGSLQSSNAYIYTGSGYANGSEALVLAAPTSILSGVRPFERVSTSGTATTTWNRARIIDGVAHEPQDGTLSFVCNVDASGEVVTIPATATVKTGHAGAACVLDSDGCATFIYDATSDVYRLLSCNP